MEKVKYNLLAILACLGWGASFAFIKLTLEYAPTFQLSGMRFMLSGLILLPFLFKKGENWGILIKEWKFILFFSFIQIFIQYSFYFEGINLIPSSVAAIVVGAGPLVVFIMAHFAFKNDKFTLSKAISLTLGMVGIIIMTLKNSEFSSSNPYYLLGIGFILISVVANSSVNIVVAKNSRPISPIMLTAVSNFLGGIMLFILSLSIEEITPIGNFKPIFWLYLTILAIISSLGFSIWFYLLKVPSMKVSEINMWKFIPPVFGAILSWIIFPNDNPDLLSIVGIVTIALGIIILQMTSKKEEQ